MQNHRGLPSACSLIAIAGLVVSFGALAAETRTSEPMKMDEPMSGEMKKKGMKQGDVKKQGEQWDEKMKEMIEKEEKTMNQGNAKK
jgi:hypothetical protein